MDSTQEAVKHQYETTVIINAALEDPQVETVITRISELITRNGGEIAATNRWGRKRLTYSIKKKNNGYYLNLEFSGPGPIVKALEHAYLLDEQIIRFLTIKLDKKALKARAMGPQTVPAAEQPVAESPKAPEKAPEKAPLFAEEPAS